MIRIVQSIRWITLAILMVAGVLLSSCQMAPDKMKTEADDYAYSAIEKKWDTKFGIQANYKVKDAEGAEPTIVLEQVLGTDGILSLPEAVLLATANNRLYQLEKDNLYTKALDLRLVRHLYEPNPFGIGSSIYTETDDASSLTTSGALGFNQLLASGGQISAQVGAGWVEMLSGNFRSGMTHLFSATVSQPLLRGAGREVALNQLTQAEHDLLYQVRLFNHFRQQFVVQIISQYYLVVKQQEKVAIAQENFNRLDMIHGKTSALTEVGKVAAHELEEIEQERMIAQDDLIMVRRQAQQLLDEFKLALAIPPQTELTLDPNEYLALKTLEPGPFGFTEPEAIETAAALRLDLANATDGVIDAERKVRVALDRTRAELNLVGSANNVQNPDDTHNSLFSGGVTVDLGLDRTVEKTEYRRSIVFLEQSKRTFEERRDTISLEVRTAMRKLQESHDRYALQTQATAKADKRLENTLTLLQYARANTRDVLRSQSDAYDARNKAADAVVDFAIATLEFYRSTGVLQVKPDGMWQVESAQAKPEASPDSQTASPAPISVNTIAPTAL
jgi:outer membrane protein TolC